MNRSSLLRSTGVLDRTAAPAVADGAAAEAPRSAVDAADRRLLRWLFVASLLVYLFTAGSNFSSGDAQSELRVDQALIDHGWVNVPQGKPGQLCGGWGCQGADGRFYATHGIGYSLYLFPFYVVALAAADVLHVANCERVAQPAATHAWNYCVPIHLVSWSNSLLAAGTVALLCLICLELGYDRRRSLALALLYGFGTLAWPYARFGFDVTLTALLLLAAYREALLAARADGTPSEQRTMVGRWGRCGGLAALAILVRLPAAAAVVPLFLFMVAATRRGAFGARLRAWAAFLAPLALAVAFTCWYNWARFGSASPLADGHAGNAAERLTTFPLVSLTGMLISPGKGVLWYAPPVLLALLCVPAFWRRRHAACALVLGMAVFGIAPYLPVQDWIGGDAWGPRFVVQVLPFLALPAIELPAILRTARARLLAALLIVVGVCIQLAGMLVDYNLRLRYWYAHGISRDHPDTLIWDPRYSPIGDHLATLWSYIVHWQTARLTSDKGVSFDVWWLNLWRNDGRSPMLTMLAGGIVAVLAVLAALRLAVVARARPLTTSAGAPP